MVKKPSLSYQVLQLIKTDACRDFFAAYLPDYLPYLNHLGEVQWMTETEADQQHEFYVYSESFSQRLKERLLHPGRPAWRQNGTPEWEVYQQIRAHLEETYLGGVQPGTLQNLPTHPQVELSVDEIDHIPVTLDTLEPRGSFLPLLGIVGGIILGAAAALLFFLPSSDQPTGQLLLTSNVKGVAVYIDDTKRGYADYERVIENLPPGDYRVSMRKPGYQASPLYRDISLAGDTTIALEFAFTSLRTEDQGFLDLRADYDDSKVFINNDFYGQVVDQPLLNLPEGEHLVVVEKAGFVSEPRSQTVVITPGDTTRLAFSQRRTTPGDRSSRGGDAAMRIGSLYISANVAGGRIFLNGEDSGRETDHVFTNLPLGTYTIRIERDGYEALPSEHSVTLSRAEPQAEFAFDLVREFVDVDIRTDPPGGAILLDGTPIGTSRFSGPLKIGTHRLSFGPIPGYKTPAPRTITLDETMSEELVVAYFPEIDMSAEVNSTGNLRVTDCDINTGYTFSNRGFSASEEAGPEIVFDESLGDYVWKLGYAFPYRNPKGNDALKLSFTLPQNTGFQQAFTVRMEGTASSEKYPLSLGSKVDVKVKFNGKILSYYYNPQNRDGSVELKPVEWDVSGMVKPGINTLEISTTEDNNTFFLLKRVRVFN